MYSLVSNSLFIYVVIDSVASQTNLKSLVISIREYMKIFGTVRALGSASSIDKLHRNPIEWDLEIHAEL